MRHTLAVFFAVVAFMLNSSLACCIESQQHPIKVGSKNFTESIILGDALAHLLQEGGTPSKHYRSLGGTPILWNALLSGEIDVYPEYSGTIIREILAKEHLPADADLAPLLARFGVGISKPLGFNNTYIIGMRADTAAALQISRISDLQQHPELKLGFCSEFVERKDGWPALQQFYGLPQRKIAAMEHEITYRALLDGTIAATNLYSTDAEINIYHLIGLQDDLHLFPRYDAVLLYRLATARTNPVLGETIGRLAGRIDSGTMVVTNAAVKQRRVSESQAALELIVKVGLAKPAQQAAALQGGQEHQRIFPLQRLWQGTKGHLLLVFLPLLGNILIAVPLGIWASYRPAFAAFVLGSAGVVQAIPSLALLVFLIPLFGIGYPPAMTAMFIYGMLPILKNTCLGLTHVPASLKESADALGLSSFQRLCRLELPLAAPSILAGIKVAAVLNVGTATLGAIIGAGGLGELILSGIRNDDIKILLAGSIPAAMLAILIQWSFGILERQLVPAGLRLARGE